MRILLTLYLSKKREVYKKGRSTEASQLKRLKELEEENRKLKQMYADQLEQIPEPLMKSGYGMYLINRLE